MTWLKEEEATEQVYFTEFFMVLFSIRSSFQDVISKLAALLKKQNVIETELTGIVSCFVTKSSL